MYICCCLGTQTEDPSQAKTPATRDFATQCCLLSTPQPVKCEGEELTTDSETAEESDTSDYT